MTGGTRNHEEMPGKVRVTPVVGKEENSTGVSNATGEDPGETHQWNSLPDLRTGNQHQPSHYEIQDY